MSFLCLDLSKNRTGFALWRQGWEKPRVGQWRLGSEYTSNGGVFANLHKFMNEIWRLERFEFLYFEEPISPAQLQGHTTIQTINLAIGLAAHAESFGHARRCRIVKAVNVEAWRKHWIGRDIANAEKAKVRRARKNGDVRASARDALKLLTIERARQLGLDPRSNDEADSIGILDYALELNGIAPPWRLNEVLRPLLGGAA